jgi:DNA polymerase-1
VPRASHLIIDGRHMLYRASDAFQDLSVALDGEEQGTGGIYGFLNVALRVFRRYGGTVHVCWEGKRSRNFRRGLYPDYKKREPPDEEQARFLEDMQRQEIRLKAVLRAIGVRQYEGVDCEADDVIAEVASWYSGHRIIYTGDSDLRQLVDYNSAEDDGVTVVSPGFKGVDIVYDAKRVREKHGVPPHRLADLKALAGDNSDGIPGLKGVGPKTAAILVNAFGDVENVIAASANPEGWPVAARFQPLVAGSADDIRLFKKLTSVLPGRKIRQIDRKRDKRRAMAYFHMYKFRSLLAPNELYDIMRMGEDD